MFTHYALLYYFPNLKLPKGITKTMSYLFVLILIILSFYNYYKWYSFINFTLAAILITTVINKSIELLRHFYLTFLVMLIPFFIVNGILTGSFIENEVVWYNNLENLNIRIFTIPIEDIVYAFTLILLILFIMNLLGTNTKQTSK